MACNAFARRATQFTRFSEWHCKTTLRPQNLAYEGLKTARPLVRRPCNFSAACEEMLAQAQAPLSCPIRLTL
jgi:hypothetical protein